MATILNSGRRRLASCLQGEMASMASRRVWPVVPLTVAARSKGGAQLHVIPPSSILEVGGCSMFVHMRSESMGDGGSNGGSNGGFKSCCIGMKSEDVAFNNGGDQPTHYGDLQAKPTFISLAAKKSFEEDITYSETAPPNVYELLDG
eukprot:scaffold2125_cov126-Cylindrotheca_fusiformis.AAC.2